MLETPLLLTGTWRFEDLKVGQEADLDFCIQASDVEMFVELSGDASPLHTDEQYARRTKYRGCVAHGMLVALPISTLVGMCLPGQNATLLGFEIRYQKPVRIGDKLHLNAQVESKSPALQAIIIKFAITCEDQVVAQGKARVLVGDPPRPTPLMGELTEIAQELNLNFSGAVALVTGASRGIGAIVAKLLTLCGARVCVNYYRCRHEALANMYDGGIALTLQADVRVEDDVQRMVNEAALQLGPVDILVNNAVGSANPEGFSSLTWVKMQKALDVILGGAFNCIQAVLPSMLERGKGIILNVTTRGLENPPVGSCTYLAAKGGLASLTKALAVEVEPRGVKVCAFAPPVTDTDLVAYIPAYHRRAMELADPVDIARDIVALIGKKWHE